MKQYKETEYESYVIGNMTLPAHVSNKHYRQMLEEVDKGEAEIIAFDYDAKQAQDSIDAEVAWVVSELREADVELNKVLDVHGRRQGTEAVWRQYRNDLRDHVVDGAVMGPRPVYPVV